MKKDAMWSVWLASAGESQHRLLGFCSNTRPSIAGNYYISFKKQHLCPIRPDRDKASDDVSFPAGAPELLPGNHMTVQSAHQQEALTRLHALLPSSKYYCIYWVEEMLPDQRLLGNHYTSQECIICLSTRHHPTVRCHANRKSLSNHNPLSICWLTAQALAPD